MKSYIVKIKCENISQIKGHLCILYIFMTTFPITQVAQVLIQKHEVTNLFENKHSNNVYIHTHIQAEAKLAQCVR